MQPDSHASPANIAEIFEIQSDEGPISDFQGTHRHPFHEIIYCHNNCGAEFFVDDHTYLLQRGDIIMIPPQVPHAWLVRSRTEAPYLGYRLCANAEHLLTLETVFPEFQIPSNIQRNLIHTLGTVWEHIGDLFRVLYDEMQFKSPGWEASSLSSFTYLLTQLGRALLVSSTMQTQRETSDLTDSVIRYVKANLGEKITLDDVAQRFWVSPSTITNLFNKKLGTSFYRYVMNLRLSEAKNLICEGMPMEKIAQKVGFNDYSAFYRAFKKAFDISPKQYLQTVGK